jgi:hypothetical protein
VHSTRICVPRARTSDERRLSLGYPGLVGGAVATPGLAMRSARAVVSRCRLEEPFVVADVGRTHYRFELPDGTFQPTSYGTRGW